MKFARIFESDSRSGQAIIFLVAVVVILAFVLMWNFDLHKTIYVKILARDAGDSAVLAAARWQGKSLNMIGELNIIQAAIMSEGLARGQSDFPEVAALEELRTRLSFVGPMVALVAAEQAAKQNGVFNNSYFSQELYRHAGEVRSEYHIRYDPPYDNEDPARTAWDDYADMLDAVADHGMPVMPTNPYWFSDYSSSGHYLLNPDFYDAISSRNWCWFHFHARGLLEQYTNWTYWPPLPELEPREPINSELFSLKLSTLPILSWIPTLDPANEGNMIEEWQDEVTPAGGTRDVLPVSASWHIYNQRAWSSWSAYVGDGFPFEGDIKPEYDLLGADAAIRLNVDADRISPGRASETVQWTAAAKPFGSLPGPVPINNYGMVLPGFSDVRLIPVDASTASLGGSREGWGIHIYEHLPAYAEQGPSGLEPDCWYCQQLLQWEIFAFRRDGILWLREYSDSCYQPPPGPGGGPGGGTRRGH
jgi:hypothetical protein